MPEYNLPKGSPEITPVTPDADTLALIRTVLNQNEKMLEMNARLMAVLLSPAMICQIKGKGETT